MTDIVVFRTDKKLESVMALFPEIPWDNAGQYCTSYEHVGQHGGADYDGMIAESRPSKPSEYHDLKRELEGFGYELDVRTRRPRR